MHKGVGWFDWCGNNCLRLNNTSVERQRQYINGSSSGQAAMPLGSIMRKHEN